MAQLSLQETLSNGPLILMVLAWCSCLGDPIMAQWVCSNARENHYNLARAHEFLMMRAHREQNEFRSYLIIDTGMIFWGQSV